MKQHLFVKTILVVTIAIVLGFGASAFAQPGGMYGRWGYGPGMPGPGIGTPPCMTWYGYAGSLSEAELKKLYEQRSAFGEATKDLHNRLYQKGLELRTELAKQNPDPQKAANLQKEISELKAQLDQKRIEHQIEMNKINPNVGRGFAGRGPGGFKPGFRGGRF